MFTNLFAIQLNHVLNLLTSFGLLFVLQSFFRLMPVSEKIPIGSDLATLQCSSVFLPPFPNGFIIATTHVVGQPVEYR